VGYIKLPHDIKQRWRFERVTLLAMILSAIGVLLKTLRKSLKLLDTKEVLYVQLTVHRDNLRINNQQDASGIQNFYFVTKLHIFRASSVPIIRSYQLFTWQLVCFMQVLFFYMPQIYDMGPTALLPLRRKAC
jgi:hypothetical protein